MRSVILDVQEQELIGCCTSLVHREQAHHHHVPWERGEPRPQDPTRRHILQEDAV